jgi:C-terminal processing protease CtpA/Prc
VSPQAVAANDARLKADAAAAGEASRRYAELYARTPLGAVADFELPPTPPRPDRFRGKVFLLVDRQSYSNTVNVGALAQDYRFGTVLGEETSDLATVHGAMERFTLPHTGAAVGFPKAFIVRPNGDRTPRGVIPDVAIAAPIVETPKDEMLQAALAHARAA